MARQSASLLVLLLVASLAGCTLQPREEPASGDPAARVAPGAAQAGDRVSLAAQHTLDRASALVSVTVRQGADGDIVLAVTGEEVFDDNRRRFRDVELAAFAQRADEIIVDGAEVYLRSDAEAPPPWVRFHLDEFHTEGIPIEGPHAFPFRDSRMVLDVLRRAHEATEVGAEVVSDLAATLFSVVVAPDDVSGTAGQWFERLTGAVDGAEVRFDVWLVGDESGDELIRRVRYYPILVISDEESHEDTALELVVTVEYSEFDIGAEIELPDEADVEEVDPTHLDEVALTAA